MNEGGLLAPGLTTMAGVGMDGIGIELLEDEITRLGMWVGTGSADGTWASGAAMEAGIASGMCGGTLTRTDTGAEMAAAFLVSVGTIWGDGGAGGGSRFLDWDSSMTITLCNGVALFGGELWVEGSSVVVWALEGFGGCKLQWKITYQKSINSNSMWLPLWLSC